MRVYHDWEFLEDGRNIFPLSVGMVAENGKELYYEFSDAPWSDVFKNQWLVDNVVPHLTCTKDGSLVAGFGTDTFKSKLTIRRKIYEFLENLETIDGELELWGWYSSYDHVCLAQMFGKMIDLPAFVPMWTNDLRQEFHRLGNPEYPAQTSGVHNALEDAKHIKRMHEWLLNRS